MPINFSDLVAKVEAQNQQNRQQLVAQVMPAIDLMVKRREYDYENEQFASGLQKMATDAGMEFTPDPTQTPQMQQAMFGEARNRFETEKKSKAFYESTGQPLPEGWDKLSPEARIVKAKRDEQDYSTIQAISAAAEAYPEVKPLLEKNKGKSVAAQEAIVKKYFAEKGEADEWETWKRKANYTASLSDSGGDGGSKHPTWGQATDAQKAHDLAIAKVSNYTKTGVARTVGAGDKVITRVAKVIKYTPTVKGKKQTEQTAVKLDSGLVYTADGKFYDSSGKKVDNPDWREAKMCKESWADYNDKVKASRATRAKLDSANGVVATPAPETQAAKTAKDYSQYLVK